MYDVQGARSGLLPADYLGKGDYTFSQCIGLFAFYNDASPFAGPKVNESLSAVGYGVRRGGWGRQLGAAGGPVWRAQLRSREVSSCMQVCSLTRCSLPTLPTARSATCLSTA